MTGLQFAGVILICVLLLASAAETWIIGCAAGEARGYRILKWAVLVLVLLTLTTLLPACTPASGGASVGYDPAQDNVSRVPPTWALDPVGQYRNMDWHLWSCPYARGC